MILLLGFHANVIETFGVGVRLAFDVVVRANHAQVLLLDRVYRQRHFVYTLHVQVVEQLLLVQRVLELSGDRRIP